MAVMLLFNCSLKLRVLVLESDMGWQLQLIRRDFGIMEYGRSPCFDEEDRCELAGLTEQQSDVTGEMYSCTESLLRLYTLSLIGQAKRHEA